MTEPDILVTTHLCACDNLRRASRAVMQRYDTALAATGLRATQFALLALLARTGPITLSRLAHAAAMDRTTLTRNLAPLERRELVVTGAGEDRRTRIVRLTGAGETILTAALPRWQGVQERTVAAFGAARFPAFLEELGEIAAPTR